MRVRVDTYAEFKAQAAANQVYFTWDPKGQPDNPEKPLFFARVLVNGVTLEFWCEAKPASFETDFPAAVPGIMEE